MVRMTGFEPAASCSQSKRSTKLSHIRIFIFFKKEFFDALFLLGYPANALGDGAPSSLADPGHSLASLHLPPAALSSLPKLSHIRIFNKSYYTQLLCKKKMAGSLATRLFKSVSAVGFCFFVTFDTENLAV